MKGYFKRPIEHSLNAKGVNTKEQTKRIDKMMTQNRKAFVEWDEEMGTWNAEWDGIPIAMYYKNEIPTILIGESKFYISKINKLNDAMIEISFRGENKGSKTNKKLLYSKGKRSKEQLSEQLDIDNFDSSVADWSSITSIESSSGGNMSEMHTLKVHFENMDALDQFIKNMNMNIEKFQKHIKGIKSKDL